jgi:hypothetical protein
MEIIMDYDIQCEEFYTEYEEFFWEYDFGKEYSQDDEGDEE